MKLAVSGCGLKVDWDEVKGSNYKVEIKSKEAKFSSENLECEKSKNFCWISMNLLNIGKGEKVVVRVQAGNEKGYGPAVEGVYLSKGGLAVPETPKMPQLVSISDSQQHITLKWSKSPNGLQYELLWNEGKLNFNATKLIVRGKLN